MKARCTALDKFSSGLHQRDTQEFTLTERLPSVPPKEWCVLTAYDLERFVSCVSLGANQRLPPCAGKQESDEVLPSGKAQGKMTMKTHSTSQQYEIESDYAPHVPLPGKKPITSKEITNSFARLSEVLRKSNIRPRLPHISYATWFALLALFGAGASMPLLALPFAYVAAEGENAVHVLNTVTNLLEDRIALDGTPTSIAVSPDGSTVYVGVSSSVTISEIEVIDTPRRKVVARVPVGLDPSAIAVSPDGHVVYVANANSNTVSVIDSASRVVIAVISVGQGPRAAAITPDGTALYVANSQSNSLSVIDTRTNHVLTEVPTGAAPSSIAVAPHSPSVYVTANVNSDIGGVWVVDTNKYITTKVIAVPRGPQKAAITPDGSRLYVTHPSAGNLSVIDTNSTLLTGIIPVVDVASISTTPDGHRAYLARPAANSVSVMDITTNRITDLKALPGSWWLVVVLPPSVYAVVPTGAALTVINTFTFSQSSITLSPGATLNNVAVTPDGTKAYVTDLHNFAVWAVDLIHQAVLAKITGFNNPQGIAITPNGEFVYVVNSDSNNVMVIQTATNTVVHTIAVGQDPNRLAITPAGMAYVANLSSNSVSVIDTTAQPPAVVAALGTSDAPFDIAVSPDGKRVYIACLESLLVIDATEQPPAELNAASLSSAYGNVAAGVTADGSQVFVGNEGFIWVVDTATLNPHKITGFDASLGMKCIRMDHGGDAYVLALDSMVNLQMYVIDVKTEKKFVSVTLGSYLDSETMAITPPM